MQICVTKRKFPCNMCNSSWKMWYTGKTFNSFNASTVDSVAKQVNTCSNFRNFVHLKCTSRHGPKCTLNNSRKDLFLTDLQIHLRILLIYNQKRKMLKGLKHISISDKKIINSKNVLITITLEGVTRWIFYL